MSSTGLTKGPSPFFFGGGGRGGGGCVCARGGGGGAPSYNQDYSILGTYGLPALVMETSLLDLDSPTYMILDSGFRAL